MKISHRNNAFLNKKSILKDLYKLANAVPIADPLCSPKCEKYITVKCNKNCEDASVLLSSDLDNYPLEGKITPLVFELKRIGFYTPCWSCEGHLGVYGELWKLPCVWFYTESLTYLRVLGEAIKNLSIQNKLKFEWEIKLVPSEPNNLDSRFALQPSLQDSSISLEKVQDDINILSENLFIAVTSHAQSLISSLE